MRAPLDSTTQTAAVAEGARAGAKPELSQAEWAPSRGEKRKLVGIAQALYLFYYMALGAFMPFINLYYERRGLSGVQIGTLAALPVLVSIATSMGWSALADARGWHRPVLRLALVLAPLALFIVAAAQGYPVLVMGVLLYAFFSGPIVPLLDRGALEASQRAQRPYGVLRVWGTIGWLISSLVVGVLIDRLDIRWLFYAYWALIVFTWLPAWLQPGSRSASGQALRHGLRQLLRRDFVVFLVSLFFVALASGGANAFFSLYMEKLGASESLIGAGWSLAALAEIPVMLLSGRLLRAFGARRMLIAAFALFAARWLIYSLIHHPVLALAAQALQGLTFAPFLVAGVAYVGEHTPEAVRATGLTLFNMVAFGLASIAGSMVSGYLYDAVGVWRLFGVLSLVTLAGLVIFVSVRPKPQSAEPG